MMKKGLLFALLIIAVAAMPAFASVQNVKLSGDIDSGYVYRSQFDLGDQTQTQQFKQRFFYTITRLRVDADLTDNVSATVALINERAWDESLQSIETGRSTSANVGANDIDINLAYVTLREMLYSPLTVIVGRQNFAYGNSFVIDSAGVNNVASTGGLRGVAEDLTKATALDAIRAILDYNPLTIDIVYAKVDANNLGGGRTRDDDVDLFGANFNYQLGDDYNSVIEAYFWAKVDQSVKGTGAGKKADTVYMPGIHISTNPIKGLNLQLEGALQRGNKATTASGGDNVIRQAQAAQFIANYMLPFEQTADWSPVITTVYTYTSGDSNPGEAGTATGDDHYTAWDPMFENQGGGTIYNTLFNLTNAHIATVRGQVKPMDDVTAILEWNGIWLDKEVDDGTFTGNCSGATCFTLLQPDGSTTTPRVTTNTKVGDEVGVRVVYDYTEDVQIGARADWFFPGEFFHSDNDQVATQVLVNGNVNF